MKYHYPILLIFLLSVINSQYIVKSANYDKILMYTFENLEQALNNKLLDFLQKQEQIKKLSSETITITEFKYSSTSATIANSYGNMNTGLFLLSPNKLSLTADIKYYNNDKPEDKFNAQFELSLFNLQAKLAFPQDSNDIAVPILLTLRNNDFHVYGANSVEDQANIVSFLITAIKGDNVEIEKLKNSISQSIVQHFKDCYANKTKYIMTWSNFFDSREIVINNNDFFGFNEDVVGRYENAVTYLSGRVGAEPQSIKKTDFTKDDFLNPSQEKLHLFLHYNILRDIFGKILSDKSISYTLDKNTILTIPVSLDFTVLSLKQVFEGVPSDYEDTDEYVITSVLKEVKMNINGEGEAVFSNAIKVKETENVIQMTTNFVFGWIANVVEKGVGFNVCVRSVKMNQIVIDTQSVTVKEESLLSEWSGDLLSNAVGTVCVADNKIPLKDTFRFVDLAKMGENGIYLYGRGLYQ